VLTEGFAGQQHLRPTRSPTNATRISPKAFNFRRARRAGNPHEPAYTIPSTNIPAVEVGGPARERGRSPALYFQRKPPGSPMSTRSLLIRRSARWSERRFFGLSDYSSAADIDLILISRSARSDRLSGSHKAVKISPALRSSYDIKNPEAATGSSTFSVSMPTAVERLSISAIPWPAFRI